jgi:hypothetical protein
MNRYVRRSLIGLLAGVLSGVILVITLPDQLAGLLLGIVVGICRKCYEGGCRWHPALGRCQCDPASPPVGAATTLDGARDAPALSCPGRLGPL